MAPRDSRVTHARMEAKKVAFLQAFGECGVITVAAEAATVNRRQVYEWRQNDEQFAKAFDEGEERAHLLLIAEARRRAAEGYNEFVVSGGRLVKDEDGNPLLQKRYSDQLLKFLIERREGQPVQRVEHAGEIATPKEVPPAYVASVLRELDSLGGLAAPEDQV